MKIKAVVFNHNQRETAEVLYEQLKGTFDTAFFDSGSRDDQISPLTTHRFGNVYWTGCWNNCWELFSDADIVWGIGGDITLQAEPAAYLSAMQTAWPFAVWSPAIEGRSHEFMQPDKIANRTLSVLNIEGMAFAISKELWKLVGPFDMSNYIGYGHDCLATFIARQNDMINIIDGRVQVYHPPSQSYHTETAKQLMEESLCNILGPDWNDRMDWWWHRRITFASNVVSEIRFVDNKRVLCAPFQKS